MTDRVERVDLGPAVDVVFSPDGRHVLAVGRDEAGLFSSRGGRQVAAFPGFGTLAGPEAFFYGFSPAPPSAPTAT